VFVYQNNGWNIESAAEADHLSALFDGDEVAPSSMKFI